MKTFLVVEDSRVIRVIASKTLRELGFNVLEAEDGQAAMEICRQEVPDAILLDWMMPIKDGLAFVKDFRQLQGNEKTTVIFCTSKNNPQDIKTALDNGADEYIMKPFDSEILRLKLMVAGLL